MTYILSESVLRSALAAATAAAEAAAAIMNECFERRLNNDQSFDLGLETKSSSADLVTMYDKKCEEVVIRMLSTFTANLDGKEQPFRLLTEESHPDEPLTDFPTWVIDPIDGTTSFVHTSFDCGVSVGLAVNREPVVGVVVLPRLKEVFTGIKGHGAFCNGRPIRVSGAKQANKAVFCTHCPYNRSAEAINALTQINTELMRDYRVHALRAYGSAAMDMTSVAIGRLDCYFEVCIQAWDMCAAAVILREAGGVLKDITGGPFDLMRKGMVCASSEELAQIAVALSAKYHYRDMLLGTAPAKL